MIISMFNVINVMICFVCRIQYICIVYSKTFQGNNCHNVSGNNYTYRCKVLTHWIGY